MQSSRDIVKRLGGTAAVARALDLRPSVVSSWIGANSIPRWWHERLISLSEGGLTTDDFPTKRRAA
jgi:hypothetical protein